MPIIRPISKCQTNFNEVAELCRIEQEPVFITKNGSGSLVLMSIEDYEQKLVRLELYDKLAASTEQVEAGEVIGHDELFSELRGRFGGASAE